MIIRQEARLINIHWRRALQTDLLTYLVIRTKQVQRRSETYLGIILKATVPRKTLRHFNRTADRYGQNFAGPPQRRFEWENGVYGGLALSTTVWGLEMCAVSTYRDVGKPKLWYLLRFKSITTSQKFTNDMHSSPNIPNTPTTQFIIRYFAYVISCTH